MMTTGIIQDMMLFRSNILEDGCSYIDTGYEKFWPDQFQKPLVIKIDDGKSNTLKGTSRAYGLTWTAEDGARDGITITRRSLEIHPIKVLYETVGHELYHVMCRHSYLDKSDVKRHGRGSKYERAAYSAGSVFYEDGDEYARVSCFRDTVTYGFCDTVEKTDAVVRYELRRPNMFNYKKSYNNYTAYLKNRNLLQ